MSNAGRRAVTDFRDPDVERLLAGRLHDPRRVLGAHALPNGETVVRALLPYAARAELVLPSAPLERVGSTALFEWRGASANLPERYRIRWRDGADAVHEAFDPYCFPPLLALERLERFNQGSDDRAYRCLGAHVVTADGVDGVRFAVWAPNAERVSVVGEFNRWDGRCHPLAVRGSTGIWELFVPELPPGTLYKYELRNRDTGELRIKADPFGARFERRPATAGIVAAPSRYAWQDRDWLAARAERDWLRAPMSIYEVHLGSWRRGPNGEFLSYRHLAEALGAYVEDLGFTHVELMPVTEHPLDDSWGYQCTGYFAPTSRHGEPDDLRAFVDSLHARGIGVLLDWVPGHFPKDDHALARFDGTALYEYADTRKGVQPDWDTLVFDYARNEVQSFLVSSAVYWLDEFHFDGLRVDAVASMLYLDYSRKDGGWTPNVHGGNENLEAIAFLKRLNETTHAVLPGTVTVAEESTSWPMVSRPTYTGGLGFTLKWNMGWMHDTLEYLAHDPVHRKYHHNLLTFGPVYAFSENFVLPLSHDEMVHGKRSLVGKTPGDEWQRFANLRLLLTYQWTYPGKKLLFMGGELGVPWEWSHADPLPWELAERPPHSGVRALIRDLNRCYRSLPALHAADHDGHGFAWLSWTDHENSVLSYVRRHEEDHAIVLLNFTPVPREAYRVGAPRPGRYRVALNSDSEFYGGSNAGVASVDTEPVPAMGHAQSVALTLPPLAGLILVPVHEPR